jgi:hypothetical protein
LRSAHQNYSKHKKKLIFNKKNNSFKNTGTTTFPNTPSLLTKLLDIKINKHKSIREIKDEKIIKKLFTK